MALSNGLTQRLATPDDRRFVADSWKRSCERPFLDGKYQPWPQSEATKKAILHILTLSEVQTELKRPPPGPTLSSRILSILPKITPDDELNRRIISSEYGSLADYIRKHAKDINVIVVVDADHPQVILAWASPLYSYVKQIARGMGIEEHLRELFVV